MNGSIPAPSGACIPGEIVPPSNARVAAELQALAITIHVFGLHSLSNMAAERAYETPENEQVQP